MKKVIYRINKNLGLNLGRKQYVNIENLKDEKLRQFIIEFSDEIVLDEIQKQLKRYLEVNYKGIDLTAPCELEGEEYSSGYEMLSETDETYYKLTDLLIEFDDTILTLELNENSRDYYKFMYDNIELINEIA